MKLKFMLLALLLALSCNAKANSFGTDLSDIWWNSSESGWGVNIIHQNNVLFMTFFIYGTGGNPGWYVAPDVEYQGQSGGSLVYTGALYATTGTSFAAPWNANQLNVRQAGTVTLTAISITHATLSYSIDGATVTKNIVRQTWRTNSIAGSYIGASIGTYSGCALGANGYLEEPSSIVVIQSGALVTISAVGQSASCTYAGQYGQDGRMGSMSGTYSCTNGANGAFQASEIEAGISGFTARATALSGSCTWSGRIGGLRRGS